MSNYKKNKDELLNKLTNGVISIEVYRIKEDELTKKMEEDLVRNTNSYIYSQVITTDTDVFYIYHSCLVLLFLYNNESDIRYNVK